MSKKRMITEKRNFPADFSVYTENLFLPFYRYGI